MRLKTVYEVGELPLSEYPRPQMQRDSYLCLNGWWKFAKAKRDEEEIAFSQKILVPFSPETINSGVEEGFVLGKDEKLIYEREVTIDESFIKDVTFLHFGAVDQECEVYVNGTLVVTHRGGFTPFFADVSAVIKSGVNTIRVECTDETEDNEFCRGKQSSKPGTIWYTAQSGIWQTVWMESVPAIYVKQLKITPNVESSSVSIYTNCDGKKSITVYDDGKEIYSADYDGDSVEICYPFALWSPENPKLYDFVVKTESGDEVKSYFGVRSFGIGKDEKGKARLLLNGKPYFMNGILDQGYWSDGLLTYPSDKAALDELTLLKDMGFNMVRKHIKVEPLRWYHHCDKLGLIVWQDFVSGGGEYKFTHVALLPFLKIEHTDNDYKYFARESEQGRVEFIETFRETMDNLFNCTCIGVWVPFNEGWGQFDSAKITEEVKRLDGTRIIDSVSGWHDQSVGKTELKSLHTYYTPLKVPKDVRPVVLSEFGGYSMQTKGHVYNPGKEFGYKKFKDEKSLCVALEKLYLKKLKPLIAKGLCACVYTQVSDVEEEINGLVTYDRQKLKVPVSCMRAIADELKKESELVR